MNHLDAAILRVLQSDSAIPLARLAERVGLSPSACHRRVRALESGKVIRGYTARLDPALLGFGVEVFVEISLTSQSREAMERFELAVGRLPDILECHLMSGGADYVLRIAAVDLDDFSRIHRTCLAGLPGVAAMRSSFSIKCVKPWSGYPVDGAVAA